MSSATTGFKRPPLGRVARESSLLLLIFWPGSSVSAEGVWQPGNWLQGLSFRMPLAANALSTPVLILIIVLIAVLLAGGGLFWFWRRNLRQILSQLGLTMQHFANGNWDQRSPVSGKALLSGEVMELQRTFNTMADTISAAHMPMKRKVDSYQEWLGLLAQIGELIVSTRTVDELLRQAVERIVAGLGVQHAEIALMQTAGSAAYRVTADHPGLPAENRYPEDNPAGNQLTAPLGRHGQPLGRLMVIAPAAGSSSRLFQARADENQAALPTLQTQLTTIADMLTPAIEARTAAYTEVKAEPGETSTALTPSMVFQASQNIGQAERVEEILAITLKTLQATPQASAILIPARNGLRVNTSLNTDPAGIMPVPRWLPLPANEVEALFPLLKPIILSDLKTQKQISHLPPILLDLASHLVGSRPAQNKENAESDPASEGEACQSAAYLPVMRSGHLLALLVLASEKPNNYTPGSLQEYSFLIEHAITSLEKLQAQADAQRRSVELQSISTVSQAVATETDLKNLYKLVHEQVTRVFGNLDFMVALYNQESSLIELPYAAEKGQPVNLPPLSLGQGLISIVIRTGRPLRLNENVSQHTQEMGADLTAGGEAKSWLGVPLLMGREVMGALVLKDTEQEHRFSDENQALLATLASQLAGLIRNIRLLQTTRHLADQERVAARITGKVWASTDMEVILRTALQELGHTLRASEAVIELNPQTSTDPSQN